MNSLYNFGIRAFSAGANLASLRSPKIAKMLQGQKQTLDIIKKCREALAPDGFDIWFHAASLGEFEQARPIIERIRRDIPDKKIILSFFSPSGYEIRKNYDKVDCVVYLPFDITSSVRKFLDAANPHMAIFAKYEFWGNYLEELKRRDIPTYIISAIFRPSQRFFKPWGGMFRKMLRCYTHLYVQDEASRDLMSAIGVTNVTVAGDTRFDRVTDILASSHKVSEIELWVNSSPFTVVAGSSWQPDEDIYIPWLHDHPEVRAIIAPHEFDDERIEALRKRLGIEHTFLLSELQDPRSGLQPDDIHYLIIDCFGLLSSIYRYGDVAIIGGGFGAGIHNLNEAAVYDIPVLFGPNHKKFNEAAELKKCGGGFSYSNTSEFNSIMNMLLHDKSALKKAGEAAGNFIRSSVGASDKIYHDIFGNNNSEK